MGENHKLQNRGGNTIQELYFQLPAWKPNFSYCRYSDINTYITFLRKSSYQYFHILLRKNHGGTNVLVKVLKKKIPLKTEIAPP
jgi:hypothetical protein